MGKGLCVRRGDRTRGEWVMVSGEGSGARRNAYWCQEWDRTGGNGLRCQEWDWTLGNGFLWEGEWNRPGSSVKNVNTLRTLKKWVDTFKGRWWSAVVMGDE